MNSIQYSTVQYSTVHDQSHIAPPGQQRHCQIKLFARLEFARAVFAHEKREEIGTLRSSLRSFDKLCCLIYH